MITEKEMIYKKNQLKWMNRAFKDYRPYLTKDDYPQLGDDTKHGLPFKEEYKNSQWIKNFRKGNDTK
jgi:hypothetical protein